MTDYTTAEKAIIAKALVRKLDEEFAKPLEMQAKDELVGAYKETGATQMAGPNIGRDCGCVYIKEGKSVPESRESRFVVEDPQALVDWMDETRPDTDCFAADNIERFAEWHLANTGELPGGCRVVDVIRPAYQEEPTAVLKPNYRKLYEKMAPQLEAVQTLMLGGGGHVD